MGKVLCFGELLLRFLPGAGGDWVQKNAMPVYVGGAELNVATALAKWGIPVKYLTVLPDNGVSRDIVEHLQQKGIDTSPVVFGGDRMGIYYLSGGADMKSGQTVFDRKGSAFSLQPTGQLNWNSILADVSWFHFSAIVPALSESAALLCKEALQQASARNITISVDLNYRSLLWKYGKRPVDVMPDLVRFCHVIMGNIWSANTLLGIPVGDNLSPDSAPVHYAEHASETAKQIFANYESCKWVANTFRFDADHQNITYYASLNTPELQALSPVFQTSSIVDKVGSGDCFMAGLIYGLSQGHSNAEEVVGFAAAAAFGKLQERGDATQNSVLQIQKILQSFS